MKFKRLSPASYRRRRAQWHAWFAWVPIRTTDKNGDYVYHFCERVMRREHSSVKYSGARPDYSWEYKESEFDILREI